MSEFFIGQIQMNGYNFAPRNFAYCHGQLLGIAQNQALFALLGTYYGGNGTTNFALPDLRGRTPVGVGPSNPIGQTGGVENVTLLSTQIPAHTHAVMAQNTPGNTRIPRNALLATSPSAAIYTNAQPNTALAPNTIGIAGATQPHSNMQPFSTINFCIALQGIFPSRN